MISKPGGSGSGRPRGELAGDVEHDRAVEHEIDREVLDAQLGAEAARGGGGRHRVHTAVQLEVAADVADGVEGGRAVLPAEVHDVRGPRHAAARHLAEDLVRHLVRAVERERVGRVQAEHGRLLVPGEREVEDPGALHRAHEVVGGGAGLGLGSPGGGGGGAGQDRTAEPLSSAEVAHEASSSR